MPPDAVMVHVMAAAPQNEMKGWILDHVCTWRSQVMLGPSHH